MEDLWGLIQDLHGAVCPSSDKVTKLNGTNFLNWKREMVMYLTDEGLLDVITDDTPVAQRDAAWFKKNNRAMLVIFHACESSQQNLIVDQPNTFSVWKKL